MSRDVNSLHHVISITPNKMADNDMSFRQRAVIEFLVKEEICGCNKYIFFLVSYGVPSFCLKVNAHNFNKDKFSVIVNISSTRRTCFRKPHSCMQYLNIHL